MYNPIGIPYGSDEFTVPGFTGISNVLQYAILIFYPYVKKKWRFIICILLVGSAIIAVKRGDLIRLLFFILTYSVYNFQRYKVNKFNKWKIVSIIIIIIISFTVFGELRQKVSDNISFSITEQLDSKVSITSINWLYSYTAFNFEILKKYYKDDGEKYNYPMALSMPFLNLLGFKEEIKDYFSTNWYYRINGFNAATFNALFIRDLGPFYFLEMFFSVLIIGFFIILIKQFGLDGANILLLSYLGFNVFGSYIFLPQIFYGIIFAIILNLCIDKKIVG